MNAMRNGAHTNPSEAVSSVVALMQAPAANSFIVSQKLALEATRFWARRMRAYLDQVELLAGCSSANQLVAAQAQFVERLQEDYVAESTALTEIWCQPNGESSEAH